MTVPARMVRAFLVAGLMVHAACGRTSLGSVPAGRDDGLAGGDDGPRGDSAPDDAAAADQDGDGDAAGGGDGPASEALDWRVMSKGQWTAVADGLATAAAAGTTGPVDITTVPLSFGTKGWAGAVLAPNGLIYGIPLDASHVIEIDPTTAPATVREVGPDLGTAQQKWHGGVLDASGVIVGVPYSTFELLLIDVRGSVPDVRTVPVVSSVIPDAGSLWTAAVRAYDGRIHLVPGTAKSVLAIDMTDPLAPTFSDYGDVSAIATTYNQRYGGGAIEPSTGTIYAVPYGASRALAIDPLLESVTEVGTTFTTAGAWYGAVTGADGRVYGTPSRETALLVLTSAGTSTIAAPSNGCDSGISTAVGIFCLPYASTSGFVFDVFAASFTSYAISGATAEMYSGGALAPNGHIYVVPVLETAILDIDTKAVAPLDINILLGGFLNGY